MAGTVTISNGGGNHESEVKKYILSWTTDAAGAATFTTQPIYGVILRVIFDPGTAAPTDNYDVTLTDEHGLDVLAGQGANRDTANSEGVCPGVALKDGTTTSVVPVAIAGALSLSVTNGGAAKSGRILLYVR